MYPFGLAGFFINVQNVPGYLLRINCARASAGGGWDPQIMGARAFDRDYLGYFLESFDEAYKPGRARVVPAESGS